VVPRDEVATRSGADQRLVGGVVVLGDSVSGMTGWLAERVHGRSPVWVVSISLFMDRSGPAEICSFRSVDVSQTDGDR
jgi:hypothetical protein